MLANSGPLTKRNARLPVVRSSSITSVPVMSGGHQVGGELHALEAEVQHVTDRLDQQRFGQAGHADQQHVALAEHGGEHLFDDVLLADDDLGQLRRICL